MTKLERNLKRKIKYLLKKYNLIEISILNISDEGSDLFNEFEEIFNNHSGAICYNLYNTERCGLNVSVLMFSFNDVSKEFIEKFSSLIENNSDKFDEDGGDILHFLSEQFGGK